MNKEELKSCPRCKTNDFLYVDCTGKNNTDNEKHFIECDCGIKLSDFTKEELFKNWNTRHNELERIDEEELVVLLATQQAKRAMGNGGLIVSNVLKLFPQKLKDEVYSDAREIASKYGTKTEKCIFDNCDNERAKTCEEHFNSYYKVKYNTKKPEICREWISVEDKAPEKEVEVNVIGFIGEEKVVRTAKYKGYQMWKCCECCDCEIFVTHWMPLPSTDTIINSFKKGEI